MANLDAVHQRRTRAVESVFRMEETSPGAAAPPVMETMMKMADTPAPIRRGFKDHAQVRLTVAIEWHQITLKADTHGHVDTTASRRPAAYRHHQASDVVFQLAGRVGPRMQRHRRRYGPASRPSLSPPLQRADAPQLVSAVRRVHRRSSAGRMSASGLNIRKIPQVQRPMPFTAAAPHRFLVRMADRRPGPGAIGAVRASSLIDFARLQPLNPRLVFVSVITRLGKISMGRSRRAGEDGLAASSRAVASDQSAQRIDG